MRKCKCGKRVHLGDSDAVFVYDKQEKLKRVICGSCASNNYAAIKRDVYKKKKPPWNTPINNRHAPEPEDLREVFAS